MTLRTESIEYEIEGVVHRGECVYDDAAVSPRPGVIVAHEAPGLGEHPRRRARMLAELGYTAFAIDLYGEGKVIYGPGALDQMKATLAVPGLLRRRIVAACDVLRTFGQVDPQRLAAIGYCFGGRAVIELARSGAELRGVVSFHGLLVNGTPEDDQAIRAKLLICTGAEDPMVPPSAVNDFQEGLKAAGVDWQLITYGGARHAFTNREAGAANSPAMAYDEAADRRSWDAMKTFLVEVLA